MRTIIYESNVRAIFPIHGCLGLILQYHDIIKECIEELDQVKMLLNNCKSHQLQQQNHSSLVPSTSSQIPNVQPHISNDHMGASTSSHIPIFNNDGNIPNYYHNWENNTESMTDNISDFISHEVGSTPTVTNSMDETIVGQFSGVVSNNGDDDLLTSARVDLKETRRFSNNDELDVSDYGIDRFIYIDGTSFIY
ncbi:hypothetical protein RYX36_027797 [Vicia faba]